MKTLFLGLIALTLLFAGCVEKTSTEKRIAKIENATTATCIHNDKRNLEECRIFICKNNGSGECIEVKDEYYQKLQGE